MPLIFTNIVEWHQTDRVMRQFGLDQPIPEKPVNLDWEHTQQLKGKTESNWTDEMEIYTDYWKVRDTRIVRGDHLQAPLKRSSQYMRWYWDHTRKWMDPEGAIFSVMVRILYIYIYILSIQMKFLIICIYCSFLGRETYIHTECIQS